MFSIFSKVESDFIFLKGFFYIWISQDKIHKVVQYSLFNNIVKLLNGAIQSEIKFFSYYTS